MKISVATLAVPFVMLSTSAAFAFPAHSFNLSCASKSAQVSVIVNSTQADGVFVEAVELKTKNQSPVKIYESVADVPMHSTQAPKSIAFFNAGKLVSLNLPKDMIEIALEGKSLAVLSIDNKSETANCLGQATF